MKIDRQIRFSTVPAWVLRHPNLSDRAVRLWGLLDTHADRNGDAGVLSRRALAKELRVRSVRTVDAAIKELLDAGALERTPRTSEIGDPDPNHYRLLAVPVQGVAQEIAPPPLPGVAQHVALGVAQELAPPDLAYKNSDPNEITNNPSPLSSPHAEPITAAATTRLSVPESNGSKTISKTQGDPFEQFWAIYPRRVEKRAARTAFARALRRDDLDAILAGAERYRDDPNRQPEFTKYPATWLNRDCWLDEPLPERSPNGGRKPWRHPQDLRMDEVRRAMAEKAASNGNGSRRDVGALSSLMLGSGGDDGR